MAQLEEGGVTVTIATIQRMVCAEFNVTMNGLLSERRARSLSLPRQIAFYLCRELTTHSLPVIARYFLRDHSTVHHGANRCAELIAVDPAFAARVDRIREAVFEVDGPPAFPTTLTVVPRRVSFHLSSEQPVESGVSCETERAA